MALTHNEKDGTFKVTDVKGAEKAAMLLIEIQKELADPEIAQLEADAKALKTALVGYFQKSGEKKVGIPTGSVSLVQAHSTFVIATRKDKPEDAPASVECLQEILEKKLYLSVTKRVVDQPALDEAVHSGDVSMETVERAYWERPNAPYARVSIKKEGK